MRGLTGILIGGALVVVVAVALYMRSGSAPDQTASTQRAGTLAPAGGAGAKPGGSLAGGGDAGDGSRGRVADRLNQMRNDFEQRRLEAANGPGPNRRIAPTASAKSKDMVDNANKELAEDDGDDDPEEMEELRTTLFNDPDPDERIGAVLMLTGDEGPESMRMLIEAMDDPDPEVRLAVTEALGDRSDEINPDTLTKALNDKDAEVRFEAVSILGDMDDNPEAQQRVKAYLNDPDPEIRELAEGIVAMAENDEPQANNAQQPTPM